MEEFFIRQLSNLKNAAVQKVTWDKIWGIPCIYQGLPSVRSQWSLVGGDITNIFFQQRSGTNWTFPNLCKHFGQHWKWVNLWFGWELLLLQIIILIIHSHSYGGYEYYYYSTQDWFDIQCISVNEIIILVGQGLICIVIWLVD